MSEINVQQPFLVFWRDQFTVIGTDHFVIRRTGEPVIRMVLSCRRQQTQAYLRHAETLEYGSPKLGQRILAQLNMRSFPKRGRLIVERYEPIN